MDIVGVDFSGARSDDGTWIARGRLDGESLVLRSCERIGRAQLTDVLAEAEGPVIAALDFPFSVPVELARWWKPDAGEMPDLWAAAAAMDDARDFMALRDRFVNERGGKEPKRRCEEEHPESYSCLHKVNPNLVPMTFHGMRMLDRLWAAGCEVPPLESERGPQAVLLEVMPGAVLKASGLPYKGYKNGADALALRRRILERLSSRGPAPIANLDEFRDACASVHDALDAVVASAAAALWARDPRLFRHPEHGASGVDSIARLEGWLYSPIQLDRKPR